MFRTRSFVSTKRTHTTLYTDFEVYSKFNLASFGGPLLVYKDITWLQNCIRIV